MSGPIGRPSQKIVYQTKSGSPFLCEAVLPRTVGENKDALQLGSARIEQSAGELRQIVFRYSAFFRLSISYLGANFVMSSGFLSV